MPRWLSLTGSIAAALTLLAGCGGGSEGSQKRKLVLIGGPIKVFQSDVGARGPSRGDTRTFSRPLETQSGQPAGRLDGTVAITDQVRRGGTVREYRVGTVHFTLKDGTIVIGGVYVSTPNSPVPAPEGARRPILGGTGAYRGARGEILQTPLPGRREKEAFDIDLPRR